MCCESQHMRFHNNCTPQSDIGNCTVFCNTMQSIKLIRYEDVALDGLKRPLRCLYYVFSECTVSKLAAYLHRAEATTLEISPNVMCHSLHNTVT